MLLVVVIFVVVDAVFVLVNGGVSLDVSGLLENKKDKLFGVFLF